MRKAIIIGADSAGLRTAYELLKRTDIQPVILEKKGEVGVPSKRFKKDFGASLKKLSCDIQHLGGKILLNQQIYAIYCVRSEACSLHTINTATGELTLFEGDYFLSSSSYHEVMHPMAKDADRLMNLFLLKKKNVYTHIN